MGNLFGARYYDARTQVWQSPDPAYDGMNLYAYSMQNPIRYRDPNGLLTENSDGSVTFDSSKDSMTDAAQKSGWGDNWRAAADSMGVGNQYDQSGKWVKGSNSLVGKTLNPPSKHKQTSFLYGYVPGAKDDFRSMEAPYISDDLQYVQSLGFGSPRLNNAATSNDMLNALYDPRTVMVVFSGHGDPTGGLYTANGGMFLPEMIDPKKLSPNLRVVIFENCYQGDPANLSRWQKSLGNKVDITSWTGTTSVFETILFNSIGVFDRQVKTLREKIKDAYK